MDRLLTEIRYHQEKYSFIILGVFVLYQLLLILQAAFYGFGVSYAFLVGLGLLILGLIYSIKVTVDSSSLYYSYGIGLFSNELSVGQISSYSIERNKNFFAWVYNPGAEYLLKLHLRSGKNVYLPCDEPKSLAQLLRAN